MSQRGEGSEGRTSLRFLLRANKFPQNRGGKKKSSFYSLVDSRRDWICPKPWNKRVSPGFLPFPPDFLKEPNRPLTIFPFSGPFLSEHMASKRDCEVHLKQLSQFWEKRGVRLRQMA